MTLPKIPIGVGFPLYKGVEYINEAIEAADKAQQDSASAKTTSENAVNTANAAVTKASSIQEQFNQVVIDGDSSVEAAQARVDAEGNAYTTLKNRLDDRDAVLANNGQQLDDVVNTDKVSKYTPIIDADMTSDIKTTLDGMAERKIKYAYLDQHANLRLEQPLAQKNVFLYGNSKITKAHENNTFYNIPDRFNFFKGEINSNYCKFAQLKKAISENRLINFTFWGDSITTNGDYLGINGSDPTGMEKGPDNITEGVSYTSFITDLVANALDDRELNFYNRAIGGERLSSWNVSQTFNSTSKTWIEHIKDTQPDVLIIGFGMNHNTFDYAKTFAYNIKQVYDYINANFTRKPDLVFVTTPRPTYHPEVSGWGSFENQASRQITANAIRNVASKYKAYVIDVNRIGNIKRNGTDWLFPTYEEQDVSNVVSGVYDELDGSYIFNANAEMLEINKYMKDFVLKFTVTFSAFVDNDALTISYNRTGGSQRNNQLTVFPQRSGVSVTQLASYTNIADFGNWGNSGLTIAKNLDAVQSTLNLRIEKKDNIIEVHEEIGGSAIKLLLRDKIRVWDTHGIIRLSNTGNLTSQISNLKVYQPIYDNYMQTITEQETWGQFVDGDYTLKSPFGGNGVNHPSSIGVKEMYLPAIKEFVGEIGRIFRSI
jgi:GDSL-like Lipase/Acylhydrolase family